MPAEPATADSLLLAARTEPDAFAALYRHFERDMLGFFMRATGQAELAADLTAETFARALESIERYEPTLGRADQWLFGIARNVLASSYRSGQIEADARKRLAMPALHLSDHDAEAIERLSTNEDSATLAALASLPEDQRTAVQARILDERDYAQIASDLQCSQALVRQRVSRGLRQLRERIGGEG
ncbi:MAG: RNA polymerase sigma factor [Solirubrobacteraceae bacterium]